MASRNDLFVAFKAPKNELRVDGDVGGVADVCGIVGATGVTRAADHARSS